jgi:hypothetical protein
LVELVFSNTSKSTPAVSTLPTLRTQTHTTSLLESTTCSLSEKARSQSSLSSPLEESSSPSSRKETRDSTELKLKKQIDQFGLLLLIKIKG